MTRVRIPLAALRRALVASVIAVSLAGLAAEWLSETRDSDLGGLLPVFSLSFEGSFGTWYAVAVLVLSAGALFAIARAKKRESAPFHRHWRVLAVIFAYMALDEGVSIHEVLNGFDTSGVFYFAWVIPFGILVAAFAVAYVPFLRHLPPGYRRMVAAAGVIYVVGALGVELPLGWWTERHGSDNLGYALIDWCEETLEMVGASMFLSAMASYFHEHVREVKVETVA